MIPISDIKVYKFNKLDELKGLRSDEYSDYLILCLGDTYGIWYQIRNEELWDTDADYINEKYGVNNNEDLQRIISHYNHIVRTQTYSEIKGRIYLNKRYNTLKTKDGLCLFTKSYENLNGGMYWLYK